MRARSGTYLQEFPTSAPPYFTHSFLLSWLQSRSVKLNYTDRTKVEEEEEEEEEEEHGEEADTKERKDKR